MKSLLMMPPFWDPYCPPMGITQLQAFLKQRGRDVAIYDFNTDSTIWRSQRAYYDVLTDLVPQARRWNIMRLGPDYFSRHLLAWHALRHQPSKYRQLAALLLDIDGRQDIDYNGLDRFKPIFEKIAGRIEELLDAQLRLHRPTIVGCTLLTTTLPSALQIFRRVKAFDPRIRTVLGGPGPFMGAGAGSPDTQRILDLCPEVDNIVIGEGEVVMDAMYEGLVEPGRIYSLDDVTQLASNTAQSTEVHKGLIRRIDELPTPDYTGLDLKRYANLSIGVTRGCAYQCSFCYETTFWRRYRKRPISGALHDLATLKERHGRRYFFLCDSLANLFADDLAEGIKSQGLEICWDAYLRADEPLMDKAYVRHLAEGGMVRARVGIESADESTLSLMNKKTTADVMGVVMENLAEAGIQTSTLWIVGFPDEDEAAFQASLDFMTEHHAAIYAADPWQFIFHPTVGHEPVFGQLVASDSFETHHGMRRLYPEEFDSALLVRYYELDIPDIMALKIDRLERMCDHMRVLDIPNPYSMAEWRAANQRWQRLHPPVSARVGSALGKAGAGRRAVAAAGTSGGENEMRKE